MRTAGKVVWKSPSNIAFVKYWGKHGDQLPMNSSISMTLEKCHTTTSITIFQKSKKKEELEFEFTFHGKENQVFNDKIEEYFNRIKNEVESIKNFRFKIESENSFPHSSGIASSASAMSALALCLCSIEQRFGEKVDCFYEAASRLARLGSGSASRSVYKEYSTWGKIPNQNQTSDVFASPLNFAVGEDFLCIRDTILIIDDEVKKVSSTSGHKLMEHHPYANQKFKLANENIIKIVRAMKDNNFSDFSEILEFEAMNLHAMMMTATPSYTLLSPNTIDAIQRIKQFREETGAKISFTLDAGPNLHIIYPSQNDSKIKQFIAGDLARLCKNGRYISDNIGMGPELILDEFN